MAGGSDEDVARARPFFDAMGEKILHVGERGQGQTVKVISNTVGATNCATLAQALVVGKATGVDLRSLVDVLGASSGASYMVTLKAEPMLEHDYTPLFRLEHMLKDVGICLVGERGGGRAVPGCRAGARALRRRARPRARRPGLRRGARGGRGTRRGQDLTATLVCQRKGHSEQADYGISRGLCIVCDDPSGACASGRYGGAGQGSRFARRGSQVRRSLSSRPTSPSMPIAFKEWAVTVRALAEGEQLVTLRKGGIREPDKHFSLDHERFFLYPTFDHQRRDLVRESHQPELRRALEEGVWADGEPPAHALTHGRRHLAARPRPHPRVGRGGRRLDRDRPPRGRRALPVLRLDARLRREAARRGSAATRCTCCCCARTGSRVR